MKITWYGHSCFMLETAEGSVVFDPYSDGCVPGYDKLRLQADMVLCSHEHKDHNCRNAVKLSGKTTELKVEEIPSFHDDEGGTKRGQNTIHIVTAEGLRAVHMGDIGCIPDDAVIGKLAGADILMIPVGGFYTIDTEQALSIIKLINPRVTIPMHYRDEKHGYDVLSTADAFIAGCLNPVKYGSDITVDSSTEPQTALMTAFAPQKRPFFGIGKK